MTKTKVLRALSVSTKCVDDFSGFDFLNLGGNLYEFDSWQGRGYCYTREGERFKYSVAVLHEDVVD